MKLQHHRSVSVTRVLGGVLLVLLMAAAARVVSAQENIAAGALGVPSPGNIPPFISSPLVAPTLQSAPEATVVFGQTVFNLDPTTFPQDDTTVVFDPLNANRVVGGYHNFLAYGLKSTTIAGDLTGWSISTNGSTPSKNGELQPALIAGVKVPSGGSPVLSVDSAGNFFIASDYYNWQQTPSGINGVAIARSPKAGSTQGLFSSLCTGGDGNLNCWPTLKVINGENCTGSGGHFNDKPYIATDRSSSVATGSVYIVWAKGGCGSTSIPSAIVAEKCTNNLSTCTAPVTLDSTSGTGASVDILHLPHITVSPVSGKVYVTWNKYFGSSPATETDTIRMAVITPSASSTSLGTVGPLRTVVTESQPIPLSYTANSLPFPAGFRTFTYAKVGVMGSRAIVVWDRRTTTDFFGSFYFDSDILARFTDNDGATFSANQVVSTAPYSQNQPSICVDPVSSRVVVAYYSAQIDSVAKHRRDIYIATSPTGAAPYTPLRVTAVSNVTENNPFFGDGYMGDKLEAACGPDFAYVHYTANYALKTLFFSTLLVPQQDNFLAKVTLP